MRILDRYVVFAFARSFIAAITVLTMVFFIAEYLRGFWDENVSSFVLFRYNAYLIPLFFCQMMAPSAMLATMITLSLLNRKNELTALLASGIGLHHIAFLIFGTIFVGSCLSLIMYDRVIPPFARQRTVFYWKHIKGRQDFSLDIQASKIWYRSKNFIYNLKLYDKATSTIQGIGVFFFDKAYHLEQYLEAKTARYDYDNKIWELKDGMLTIFPGDSSFAMSKHFSEKKLTLPETPKDFLLIERQVETLRLKELLRFIDRNREAGLDTKAYEVDFHSRIAISFIPLVMGLLAIPYSSRPRRQGGLGRDMVICVAWILGYWLLFSLSLSLGRSGSIPPWMSVWTLPCAFLVVAIILVYRARRA